MQDFCFHTCRTLLNEVGAVERIGEICLERGIHNPIIITDEGIRRLGLLEHLCEPLEYARLTYTIFSDVVADPPEQVIEQALALARCEHVDGVIGIGGGSSLDTAKLVALLACSGETLADVYGVEKAAGPRLPLVLIPTTAGTGSEVTAVAIVTTGETTKMGVVSRHLYPDVAVLDAGLTLGLPPRITAMTGVDAMVHAVEAYTSQRCKNPYSDMLAREALRLLSANIVVATHQGDNLDARKAMLLGSCLAGQAFANAPVAAVHALAYPLGGHYHIPHGLSNSLVLPQVLQFNAPSAGQLYAELAEVVIPAQQLAASAAERCDQLIEYFIDLIARLELPAQLSAMNIPESDLPKLAADAMLQQRLLVNNPREVSEQDVLAIYRSAF